MTIQVNSDKTVAVDESLVHFVKREVGRILGRFAKKLTRVEVHLSDIDNRKTGQADKRCLVEARPAGDRPRSASANATHLAPAVTMALRKMGRSLDTFFGRKGPAVAPVEHSPSPPKTYTKKKPAKAKKKIARKPVVKGPAKVSLRGPKKKRIYQARRKPWPSR